MAKIMHQYDTHHELFLTRRHNGIILIKPEDEHNVSIDRCCLEDIFSLEANVYFLNTESQYKDANEITLQSNGFTSLKSALGNTVQIVAEKNSARLMLKHDQEVMRQNTYKITHEHFVRNDELDFHTISIKFPWYNHDNKIIGVFGISIFSNMMQSSLQTINPISSLVNSLSFMTKTGLLNQFHMSSSENLLSPLVTKFKLTNREQEIISHIIRGKTAKETALLLGLSKRTVEHYLENIKNKVGVTSKSELIAKMIRQ